MTSDSSPHGPWSRAGRGPLVGLLLALFFATATRAETRFSSQILPSFFTGDFDSGVDTDIVYVPLILAVTSERQDFRITVPHLSIRTDEPVTFAGGEIITRGGVGETTVSGLGDVILKEEGFLVRGDGRMRPWLSGIVRVKLPTADEEKGLGTGELDYGPGAAIVQPLGRHVSLLAELQYVVRGDPPGTDFRNTWGGSAGVQWRASEAASISLLHDNRQSVIRGRENLKDLSLSYDHRLSGSVTFRSSLYYGLSENAEDLGFSLGMAVRGDS